jgi:hypothetical protein
MFGSDTLVSIPNQVNFFCVDHVRETIEFDVNTSADALIFRGIEVKSLTETGSNRIANELMWHLKKEFTTNA